MPQTELSWFSGQFIQLYVFNFNLPANPANAVPPHTIQTHIITKLFYILVKIQKFTKI